MSEIIVITAPSKAEAKQRLDNYADGEPYTVRTNAEFDVLAYRPLPLDFNDCASSEFDVGPTHVIVAVFN